MSHFLLVDFGASRVKYACYDVRSGRFCNQGDVPTPAPALARGLYWEESPNALRDVFFKACSLASRGLRRPPEGVMLSAQMHGFVVLDHKNRPLSRYVSWKDERSLENSRGADGSYAALGRELGARYQAVTGMRMRPCLPAFNFAALARKRKLPRRVRLASLPQWLCTCCEEDAGLVHETVFAGLGFYDLSRRRVSEEIYEAVADYCGSRPEFGCPVSEIVPSAYLKTGGAGVPLYVGVGDHQCAVLGAGNIDGTTLSVNVGTGSQVSSPGFVSILAERRPYFENALMGTVTHIPAGRALDEFLGLFGESRRAALWRRLKYMSSAQALDTELCANLAVFSSAYGYRGGGSISGAGPGSLTQEQYLRALVKGMALNYASAAELFAGAKFRGAVFSGGVSRKIPALAGAFERLSGIPARICVGGEETLAGLAMLALKISGRARGLGEAAGMLHGKGGKGRW